MIVECRKLYSGHFDEKNNAIEEIASLPFAHDDITMFVGEIVNIWVK